MTQPDIDECTLRIEDLGVEVSNWNSYTFTTDFLTPVDGFTFTIGDGDLPRGVTGRIKEGQRVTLLINGRPTCAGRIDEWSLSCDREGGTVLTITGRDVLADALDSGIDPKIYFAESQTLADVCRGVFGPFGFTDFDFDNQANRDLISGNTKGVPLSKVRVSKRGRVSGGKELKKYILHIAKPYPNEGAYEFVSRLAKREGLHVWASADGKTIVVGVPTFAQRASYSLFRKRGIEGGAFNNVLAGTVKRSRTNQPSVILATGVGGGGEFGKGRLKVAMVNDLIGLDVNGNTIASVDEVLKRHPDAVLITADDLDGSPPPQAITGYQRARPMFLHDDEARDMDELKNFVKREMATKQQQALQVHYDVAGHSQDGKTWAVDTIASVHDDPGELDEDLWVRSVTFTKSRSSGTKTELHLIRPYTLRF